MEAPFLPLKLTLEDSMLADVLQNMESYEMFLVLSQLYSTFISFIAVLLCQRSFMCIHLLVMGEVVV